jgi:hypothetical protein
MKLLPALFSAVLAVSFSSLAAAQSTGTSTDKDRAGVSKSAKKSTKKSSRVKAGRAAGGASSSAETNANGRGNSNTSSPSQNTGTPGSANQGSIHNDQSKK